MLINTESSIAELVNEFVIKEKDYLNELNCILIKVKNDQNEYFNLLKAIEVFVNNTNDNLKKNSVKLISLVVERVKNLQLPIEELKRLLDFAYGKMKDVVCAPFAVKIVFFLISENFNFNLHNLSEEIIASVLKNFNIEKFHIPSYYQETRYYSLKVLTFLIENFHNNKYMQDNILDYIQIVLDGIEGEKDPRNILIMFQLVNKINSLIPRDTVKQFAKNFFEIIEVYYPIEFSPPKNSPDKITPDDLIDALNDCFASSEFYLEHLIEVIRDKISSSMIETKIQVLKTIRKINDSYSPQIMKNSFITILNLILHQILNNEDEVLHMEAIITYKEMIKRMCEEVSSKMEDHLEECEKHIITNINKIFEKSEDLLFSCENPKNSFDAKDLIVILIEFANIQNLNFKERALKICFKLINTYMDTSKNYFLKNANSILFFTLKSNQESLTHYFETNSSFIKNLVLNLIKRSTTQSEEIESIIDIVTCFIVKTNSIFTIDEVAELFTKIFNSWRECDNSIENHLAICLNEIIVKHETLNNFEFVVKLVESKLKECKQEGECDINDICKYLNLIQNYSKNIKVQTQVVNFLFETFMGVIYLQGIYNASYDSILTKLTNVLIAIFDSLENIYESNKEKIHQFLNSITDTNNTNMILSKHVQNNISIVMKKLIEYTYEEFNHSLMMNIINQTEVFIENNKFDENIVNSVFNSYLKIKIILIKDTCTKNFSINLYLKFLEFTQKILNLLVNLEDKSGLQNSIKIYEKISQSLGIAMFIIIKNKNENLVDKYYQFFHTYYDSVISSLNSNDFTEINLTKLSREVIITCNITNYLIISENTDSLKIVNSLINACSKNKSPQIADIILNSGLFKKYNKIIYSHNIMSKDDILFEIILILKTHYQSDNLNQVRIALSLMLNIYSKFNEQILDDDTDTVMSLCVKALELRTNLQITSELLKKMLKHVDKDFVRRKGYDVQNMIENILTVIESTKEMQTKLYLLSCLYKLKMVINNWEEKLIKNVVKRLKPLLSDHKRPVRKYCGMCINIWSMNEN